MFKVVTYLVLTDSKNYNLEHRFATKLDNFSPLSNSSLFCYTSNTRVRKHGYCGTNCGLIEISQAAFKDGVITLDALVS